MQIRILKRSAYHHGDDTQGVSPSLEKAAHPSLSARLAYVQVRTIKGCEAFEQRFARTGQLLRDPDMAYVDLRDIRSTASKQGTDPQA